MSSNRSRAAVKFHATHFEISFFPSFIRRGPRKSDVSSHAPAESVRGADSTSGMMMDGGDQIPGFEGEKKVENK